jgi:predicted ATPase
MRIYWLKLPNFRNLKNFEIDFDETQPTTVILGRNGSGKSNLIEVLVEIFRDLEEGKPSKFAYHIKYLCHNRKIEVANDPKARKRQQFQVDGVGLSREEFETLKVEVLPKHVFAYYSGWNRRLESGFDDPTRKLYREWLNNEDGEIPLRRLFYCRKEYSQLVLLAFFLSKKKSAKDLLSKYLFIEDFDSALFVLKKPYWRESKKPNAFEREHGDERFWFARGAFKHFLDRLWDCSLAPILIEESVDRDIRRPPQPTERLYLYIKNLTQLVSLSGVETPKEFFGLLESLFLSDLIDEVRVSVHHSRAGRIRFEQLSEGEQQLLTVLGLMLFTKQDESLFLLDEPDTHLNPSWIYKYYDLLEENFPKNDSQLLIATHNPLMIGGLRKNQVRLFSEEVNGEGSLKTFALELEDDPIGMGVDGLLTSDIYGLTSVLPREVLEKLKDRNRLFALEKRSKKQEEKMSQLSEELSRLGMLRSYLDPYEEAFVKAMARRHTMEQQVLSPDQIKARNETADEVLEEIFSREMV